MRVFWELSPAPGSLSLNYTWKWLKPDKIHFNELKLNVSPNTLHISMPTILAPFNKSKSILKWKWKLKAIILISHGHPMVNYVGVSLPPPLFLSLHPHPLCLPSKLQTHYKSQNLGVMIEFPPLLTLQYNKSIRPSDSKSHVSLSSIPPLLLLIS